MTEKLGTQFPSETAKESIPVCKLEVPGDFASEKSSIIESFSSVPEAGDTPESTAVTGVYLDVAGLPGSIIPLVYRGHCIIKELIIARRTDNDLERDYMKQEIVYLDISSGKQMVSRPNENRYGHARIFHGSKDEYYVEDLGSKVGTTVNKKLIKALEAVALRDDDAIDIGGKKGIRIVFKKKDSL